MLTKAPRLINPRHAADANFGLKGAINQRISYSLKSHLGTFAGVAVAGRGGGAAESDAVKKIFDIIGIKIPAQGGGRGGNFAAFAGGGAGNFTAGTGDYLVTLTVGSTTLKQKLHVERVSGGDDAFGGFGFDDEDHDKTDRSH